jgi:hypothetical protein
VTAIAGGTPRPSSRRLAGALIALGAAAVAVAAGAGSLGLTESTEFGIRQIGLLGAGLALVAWGAALLDGVRGLARRHERLAVAVLVVGLSVLTVCFQYQGLRDYEDDQPAHFVEVEQLARHEATLDGGFGDPWRYRLLAEWAASGAIRVLGDAGVDRPVLYGYLGLRLVENLAIFLLAWLLYRRLGLGRRRSAVGLGLIAFGLTQALYHAGLSPDVYAEVAFYLAAALLLLNGAFWWIVPLTALATLNRETSGLIPLMTMAMAFPAGLGTLRARRALLAGGAALVVFAATYAAVRVAVGPGDLIVAYGKHPGPELLGFNLSRGLTWEYVLRVWNVTPILAALAWRAWPTELRWFAIAVLPAWVIAHFAGAVVAEARLMLVPYALVLVPGALFIGRYRRDRD